MDDLQNPGICPRIRSTSSRPGAVEARLGDGGWREGGVGSKQGRQRAKTAARNLSDGHSRAVCSFSSTHEGKRRCQSRRGHPFICLLSRLSLSWLVACAARGPGIES
ncbi:hypothetical protein TEQG_04829 [Trichophyton equinum CBS 127.97]|uniref:Uncharacterized protein n=1 Tax=Trichophyton equinum (strain ATCC MYA-4606 / CBS 127.97) TaxID=559882 RepID=F2PVA2_TRIEC|nr:hypothetical protein TEQG_04829 [Trichophyton equinum CBS 127.97]